MTFAKGDPNINRAGRAKGSKNFTTKVRMALEALADGTQTPLEQQLIEAILFNAIVKKDPQSQKLIWNYLDGMPQLHIDHTTDGEPIGDTLIVAQLTKRLNEMYREGAMPKLVDLIKQEPLKDEPVPILGSGGVSSDGGAASSVDPQAPNKE